MPKYSPPPTSTETEIEAFASCQYALCAGSDQSKVPAIKTVVEHSFESRGGDIPGVENSHVYLRFKRVGVDALGLVDGSPDDSVCAVCGAPRVLSEQVRPVYQPLSGHDPMGLVNGTVARFDPRVTNAPDDEKTARLEAELRQAREEQRATAEKLDHFMSAFVPVEDDEEDAG